MTLEQFQSLPLIRKFISVDFESGDLLRHEVRRDPMSGLTLTSKFVVSKEPPPNERKVTYHK